MIYLDNCATTRPDEAVLQKMDEVARKCYFNQHAFYRPAIEAEKLTCEAAAVLSEMTLGAQSRVIFTSGGTESDNLAIFGAVGQKKGNVLTDMGEHPAVYETFRHMEQSGRTVGYLPLDRDGTVSLDALEERLNGETLLVSIMTVNNETGAVNDLAQIRRIMKARAPQALLHTDAVQAFGHIPLGNDADMVSVSAHKIHGPKGVGALIVKNGVRLNPILYGGGQQSGLRSGTVNNEGAAGFACAAELMKKYDTAQMYAFKQRMWEIISSGISDAVINGPSLDKAAPHLMSVGFPGVRGEVILHMLEDDGVLVSAGSACSTKKGKQNRILSQMGIPNRISDGSIRISFGRFNTEAEITEAAEKIVYNVKKFRREV